MLLFYSGHGDYSTDSVYHLTTHDTRLTQGRVVAGTGIGQPELLDRLRALPVRRLVLLINACHAGELSPVLGGGNHPFTGQPLPQQAADALLATGSGRIIITACRGNQVAYIGPGPITIFTQALTDGLRGQGLNARAGYISVFDLYTHLYFAVGEAVEKRVSTALRQRYGNTQEPELTVLKGVGPFPVALYRGSTMLGDFPTDHTPPEETALRKVLPARSRWAFRQSLDGAGNVAIGGSVSDSQIITGSNNTVTRSGRDTIQADGSVTQVGGDTITVGDVSGTGIAIGRHARAYMQQGGDQESLDRAFAQVYAAIAARPADPEIDKE
ncbi:MAG: caspase family protein [Chloroflexus sp.]|uniref:caspase family protein n=1 Tax=Chloroflexus sp. TaxID=1904827 RepID=UPI0040490909